MHRIDEMSYGYRIAFDGFLQRDDAGALLAEMKSVVRPRDGGFHVLVDLRHTRAFPAESQEVLKQAIHFCRGIGMERNAVVLNSALSALQARRIVREAGIAEWVRYIDASTEPEWERVAVDWLAQGMDPGAAR
jgi:hypothetical protein